MEVILLTDCRNLGGFGSVVKVKDGYARNYLIPNKLAVYATKYQREQFEARKELILSENNKKRDLYATVAKKIGGASVTLIKQSGEDGRLFGSVTKKDIVKALSSHAADIDKNFVNLTDAIKYVGVYIVEIAFYDYASAKIMLTVARSDSEAAQLLSEYHAEQERKKKESEEMRIKKSLDQPREDSTQELASNDSADDADAQSAEDADSQEEGSDDQ